MAIKEAFLRFREALRRKKRQEIDETVTTIRDLPEIPVLTTRARRPRRINNRKLTKARRSMYPGPLPHEIAATKAARKAELWTQYFVASATLEITQLGARQYVDAEMQMKRIVGQIARA
jgi:hypothetical protein